MRGERMFVSDGSLVTKTPISLTQASNFPWMPPMSTHGWPSAYAGIYSRQLWVYTVVSKRARATARLPLPVYRRDGQDRVRVDEHPMAALLRKPNPGMSGYDLWLWTVSTWDIYGDTFWLKKRKAGRVVGLFPLHPSSMYYENGAWSFDNGTLRLDNIADADLVKFRHFHPDSLTRGLSPLEPLRATLENEWSARLATSSFWQRGARPGTALSHPANLSDGASDRLRRQYDDLAGGASKTGATIVLEEGMTPHKLDLTAEEAQYIETRKLNREEVCAAYDIPPPVVHILDRATFSNITEQMRSMYRDTMGAILPGFEAVLETDLRAIEWPEDDIYAEFLLDGVLRGDFESRSEALSKADWMTIAEKRKVENLPFIEGTDRIFMNTATLPLDAIDAQADAIRADTAETEASADVIPISSARSALGRLSWQRDLGQVDVSAVVDGLNASDARAISGAVDAELKAGGSVADLRRRISGMGMDIARTKAPNLDEQQAAIQAVLRDYFAAQREAVGAGRSFDKDEWDARLTTDLHAVAVAVSSGVGKATVRELGFDASTYDVDRTVEFLLAVSARLADNINATTLGKLEGADDSAAVLGEEAADSRAAGIAIGVAAVIAGFAVVEAGKRVAETGAKPTKTWITGPNPRPEHAALDGETVAIDETFSNGAGWPGDDGEPGCNCTVEVSV